MVIVLFSQKISKKSNDTKKKKSIVQGFLLIELLISLVIFIFFIYLMHCYYYLTIETATHAFKRYKAISYLKSYYLRSKKGELSHDKNSDFIVAKKDIALPLEHNSFIQSLRPSKQLTLLKASWVNSVKKKYSTWLITKG